MPIGQKRPGSRRVLRSAAAMITVLGLLAVTSCTSQSPETEKASRVLQTVNVALSSAAAIQTVDGTAIYVTADGTSSSRDSSYKPADVGSELPVRVSTRYATKDRSGSDLQDLAGYTGRVDINVTVENLTVVPRNVTYDVAGQSRTDAALVGAPLTIVGSAELAGIKPNQIVTSSADDTNGTNGVLSAAGNGNAVVQWATLLAPPQSGASATLRLSANVNNFAVPPINLAVQPGLSTNMSLDGVLAGAFGDKSSSELALQKRTIELISEINSLLTKAGATITQVRENLDSTSQTLGVRTAGQLKESTNSLASTMQSLKRQLESLKTDLDATAKGTQSAVLQQLQQTLASVNSALGDTSETIPQPTITGKGCAAVVDRPKGPATVYASLLRMSAQLNGYATASADCRDQVSAELQKTIGPQEPTAQNCQESSMTCSLYGSSVTVVSELIGLVKQGDELADSLQPEIIVSAKRQYQKVSDGLTDLRSQLDKLKTTASTDKVVIALTTLRSSIKTASSDLETISRQVGMVSSQADAANRTAAQARSELVQNQPFRGSLTKQNQDLADKLCTLSNGGTPAPGKLSDADVAKLRSYLTKTPCAKPGDDQNPPPDLTTPFGYPAPMDERLQKQVSSLDSVLSATDTRNQESGIGQALGTLRSDVSQLRDQLNTVEQDRRRVEAAVTTGSGDLNKDINDLSSSLDTVRRDNGQLGKQLDRLETQQSTLGDQVRAAFRDSSSETSKKITGLIDQQIRTVFDKGQASNETVLKAFNQSISGLNSAVSEVSADGRDIVRKQQNDLQNQGNGLAAAVNSQIAASLQSIAQSTSNSTQDIDGASALLITGLNRVLLDLGDRKANGSGILGSMSASASKAGTADFQLALASQNAAGYANIRSQDVQGILLRQAQFKTSLAAVSELPAFQLDVPSGASYSTLYSFRIGTQK